MQSRISTFFCTLVLLLISITGTAEILDQSPQSWPRELVGNKIEMTIYQPQLSKKDADTLILHMTFAVKPKGSNELTYGAALGQCTILVDQEKNLVNCQPIKINTVNFPIEQNNQEELKSILSTEFTDKILRMSQEQLNKSLRMTELKNKQAQMSLDNKPPKIYVTNKPTALITIDGKPALRTVNNSPLMRVINTPFVILFDPKAGQYYLRSGKRWHSTENLEGPWHTASTVPIAISDIARTFKNESDQGSDIDHFIVTTEPAALIVTNGDPEFTPIEGTDLLYLSNSSSVVFMQIKTQRFFALISGRWYQADKLNSNADWQYVPGDNLPKSFAQIPPDSEFANILANVPGTPQAKEAVIRNEIPTIAAVEKSEAKLEVNYDGKPKFENIEQTPLRYAINANNPVIYYDNNYYANHEGIWFISDSPYGPWIVTDYIPDEIYLIPPENPLFRLTFNFIYGVNNGLIYFGYTPGYLGSYISDYGTVVYGTGYHYHPWIGDYYYGAPYTYGCLYYYHPYYGWYSNSPYLWFDVAFSLGWVSNNIWYNNWYPNHWRRRHDYWHLKKNVYNSWDKKVVKHHQPKIRERINDRAIVEPRKRVYTQPRDLQRQIRRNLRIEQAPQIGTQPEIKREPIERESQKRREPKLWDQTPTQIQPQKGREPKLWQQPQIQQTPQVSPETKIWREPQFRRVRPTDQQPSTRRTPQRQPESEIQRRPLSPQQPSIRQIPQVQPQIQIRRAPGAQPQLQIRQTPRVQPQSQIRQVPRMQPQSQIRQVPRMQPQSQIRQVPRVQPQSQIRQTPRVQPQSQIRQVPQVQPQSEIRQTPRAYPQIRRSPQQQLRHAAPVKSQQHKE